MDGGIETEWTVEGLEMSPTNFNTYVSQSGLRIMHAGQNITAFVDESSLDLKDTLGQGEGSGSGSVKRTSTASFKSTLGPVASAVGAGTHVSSPQLVRHGEIQIYDANGNCLFGGFVSKITDETEKTTVYTKVECIDYYQFLDRTMVNEVYSGQNDLYMIKDLLRKYAPWVDQTLLTTSSTIAFTVKNFRNVTLQAALQSIFDVTGFLAWIDPLKRIHYNQPGSSPTAPFGLSTSPDFRTTFQVGVTSYEIDDNALINRVYFYGGRKPSPDFAQDLSPQVNGHNTTFVLAYYPRKAHDNKIHATVNGTELVTGYTPGTAKENLFKSQGGLADALVNSDAHTVTFDVAPPAGATVICTYRYELPMIIIISDENSRKKFGGYFDGSISDQTVVDETVAIQRCRVLLSEQSDGLKTLKCSCWRAGLTSGMLLSVYHQIRQINATYLIQEIDIKPLGNGQFQYDLTLGAWDWGLVDVMKHLISATTPQDDSTDETETPIVVQLGVEKSTAFFTITTAQQNHGGYFAKTTATGDGHDAYAGYSSISS